jgi:hypothetical protein
MAVIPVQTLSRTPSGSIAFTELGASNTLVNDGATGVLIENTSGGSATVTFVTTATVDGLGVSDLAISVDNNAQVAVGPFPKSVYGSTITITSSVADSNVDIWAFKLA